MENGNDLNLILSNIKKDSERVGREPKDQIGFKTAT
jgi:hypothetical protein